MESYISNIKHLLLSLDECTKSNREEMDDAVNKLTHELNNQPVFVNYIKCGGVCFNGNLFAFFYYYFRIEIMLDNKLIFGIMKYKKWIKL